MYWLVSGYQSGATRNKSIGIQSSQKTPWPAEVRDGKYQSRERGLCGNNKTTPSTVKGDGGADELFLYRTFKVVCPSPTRSRTRAQQPKGNLKGQEKTTRR